MSLLPRRAKSYGVVAAIVLGFLLGALHLAAQSPATPLPGLQTSAQVVWDKNGVPHIFAESSRDAYRLLGWTHAHDRLWQMETLRRTAQGRMAEILGRSFLNLDVEMRGLGVYRLAETDFAALPSEVRADLDAYAAGVNSFLAANATGLPAEFQDLGLVPEVWRPADSLAWFRLMSLQLSSSFGAKALRAAIVDKVSPDLFADLFPQASPPGPITMLALRGFDWSRLAGVARPPLVPTQASNWWAVDGTRTATGKALMANDPHLNLSAPILWYLARIVTPEMSLSGATVPGVPFHLLGHNGRIAWGITNTGGDVQDLFIEEPDPSDPKRYRTPDGTAAFVVRREAFKVRSQGEVSLDIRSTRHGPVISDFNIFVSGAVGASKIVALAFLDLEPQSSTPAAMRQVARAQNWTEFKDALRQWRSPLLNFVYADVDSNIAFITAGVVPVRKKVSPDFPAPGASGEADWIAFTQLDQMPSVVNPATHMLVNANNQIAPDNFPVYIGRRFALPLRASRILEMLNAANRHTPDGFASMQVDVSAGDAALLLPRLLQTNVPAGPAVTALQALRTWDGRMDRERAEPLIFMAWMFQLQRALLNNQLSAILVEPIGFFDYDPYFIVRLLDREGAAADGADKVAALLQKSLQDAVTALGNKFGQDMTNWRWGDAHLASLKSQFFAGNSVQGGLYDRRIAVSGGYHTVNAQVSGWGGGTSFESVQGPGYRGVYDLAELASSRFIIATGQSGDPRSPHFADMISRWRDGETITLSGTADQLAAAGAERQLFMPTNQ